MAKKNKDDTPNLNSIPNRDILQRLNFLYQASSYLNGLGVSHGSSGAANNAVHSGMEGVQGAGNLGSTNTEAEGSNAMRKRSGQRKATAHDLARSYVKSMKVIGQKTTVKM